MRTRPVSIRTERELGRIEQQIYDLETSYFYDSGGHDLVRGLAGFSK